ncbi:DUF7210 family protein [Gynuella sp.]|uniref:DUF7210 family protein n=1 Tax=Gynuella sp. TaxID=2969146 RepID=UPI003D0A6097
MTTKNTQIEVTLKKAHKHAGKAFTAGDKIQVGPVAAEWLFGQGIIDNPASAMAASAETKKETK